MSDWQNPPEDDEHHAPQVVTFRDSHAWSYGYSDAIDGNRNAAKHWDATSELVQAYERGHAFGTAIREQIALSRASLAA